MLGVVSPPNGNADGVYMLLNSPLFQWSLSALARLIWLQAASRQAAAAYFG